MDQLARTPKSVLSDQRLSSLQACPSLCHASDEAKLVHRGYVCPDRTPVSVSAIQELRAAVLKIEQPTITFEPGLYTSHQNRGAWTLGFPELDNALGGEIKAAGLECGSVHEIKHCVNLSSPISSSATSWAVTLGFALRLAVRRFIASKNQRTEIPSLVWCQTKSSAAEIGHLYGPGLAGLGFDVSQILFVETTRLSDAVWAMEEALKSGAAKLVMGVLDEVSLIESRRLSLAAQTQGTPCLLMTHGARGACVTAATRWRISSRASALNSVNSHTSGKFTAGVTIERCRRNPSLAQSSSMALEWCNETHRFGMSSPLAHRAPRLRSVASAHR